MQSEATTKHNCSVHNYVCSIRQLPDIRQNYHLNIGLLLHRKAEY